MGNTGVRVSRICLGCMSYGDKRWANWVVEEEESLPLIKKAYDAGINFFDTGKANVVTFLQKTGMVLINIANLQQTRIPTALVKRYWGRRSRNTIFQEERLLLLLRCFLVLLRKTLASGPLEKLKRKLRTRDTLITTVFLASISLTPCTTVCAGWIWSILTCSKFIGNI